MKRRSFWRISSSIEGLWSTGGWSPIAKGFRPRCHCQPIYDPSAIARPWLAAILDPIRSYQSAIHGSHTASAKHDLKPSTPSGGSSVPPGNLIGIGNLARSLNPCVVPGQSCADPQAAAPHPAGRNGRRPGWCWSSAREISYQIRICFEVPNPSVTAIVHAGEWILPICAQSRASSMHTPDMHFNTSPTKRSTGQLMQSKTLTQRSQTYAERFYKYAASV